MRSQRQKSQPILLSSVSTIIDFVQKIEPTAANLAVEGVNRVVLKLLLCDAMNSSDISIPSGAALLL
jgi:hypothetical protein